MALGRLEILNYTNFVTSIVSNIFTSIPLEMALGSPDCTSKFLNYTQLKFFYLPGLGNEPGIF
jgi:hypothetical protein